MESSVDGRRVVDETVLLSLPIGAFARRIARNIGANPEEAQGVAWLAAWECFQREECTVSLVWTCVRYAVYKFGFEDLAVRVPQSSGKARFLRGDLSVVSGTRDWELELADYPMEIKLLYWGYTQREAATKLGITLHVFRKRLSEIRGAISEQKT